MAVGTAIQRGNSVYVYDERGRLLYARPAGTNQEDGLQGFTAATVTIRRGRSIYVYDDRGRLLYARPA